MKAIFFDLDGVLVDSEVLHQNLTLEFLKLEHSPIPPERFYLLIGSHKSLNPWPQIVEGIQLNEPLDDFKDRLRQYKADRLKNIDYGKLIFPETKSVLLELKKRNIKIACASSSRMTYIKKVLDSQNLSELFDLIVTCDDFERSKPAPDIYLYCLNYFNYQANECLVVEDSEIGIQAGKSAGIRVIARKDYRFHLNQSQADDYIDDLRDLLKKL